MITESQLQMLVAAYPILHDLAAPQQRDLLDAVRPFSAAAGETIFDDGDDCQQFVFVCHGEIRVIKPLAVGRELLLYEVQVGESCLLTISCLLGGGKYAARGVAGPNLCGFTISQDIFEECVLHSPLFRRFIFQNFNTRIGRLIQVIEEVGYRQLDTRLAKLLAQQGDCLIKTTHQQLANDLGTAREVVSRILRQFEEENILKLGRGVIHIVDAEKLMAVGVGLGDSGH